MSPDIIAVKNLLKEEKIWNAAKHHMENYHSMQVLISIFWFFLSSLECLILSFLKYNEFEHNLCYFKTARFVKAQKFKEFLCNYERLSGILITWEYWGKIKSFDILKANENFHKNFVLCRISKREFSVRLLMLLVNKDHEQITQAIRVIMDLRKTEVANGREVRPQTLASKLEEANAIECDVLFCAIFRSAIIDCEGFG